MKYRSHNTILILFSTRKHYNTRNSVHYTVNVYVKFTVQILNGEIHNSITERPYIFSFCVQYPHLRVTGKYPRNGLFHARERMCIAYIWRSLGLTRLEPHECGCPYSFDTVSQI